MCVFCSGQGTDPDEPRPPPPFPPSRRPLPMLPFSPLPNLPSPVFPLPSLPTSDASPILPHSYGCLRLIPYLYLSPSVLPLHLAASLPFLYPSPSSLFSSISLYPPSISHSFSITKTTSPSSFLPLSSFVSYHLLSPSFSSL